MSTKTWSAILVLVAAAVLWYVLTLVTNDDASGALELGKTYLGFAASLAGFLGIAVGGGSSLLTGSTLTEPAMATTATGLSIMLAGGAMVGGDPLVAAAALVAGGLAWAVYIFKKC
jgi:hypothetical protein